MRKDKVKEILDKIKTAWKNKYKDELIYIEKIHEMETLLKLCPDDDGLKRVTDMETGKTHLVPYEEIVINGLKGAELHKFPEEKK